MVKSEQFRSWLKQNTAYSDAVIGDIISRVRRADSCLEIYHNDVYQFYLERNEHYKNFQFL